MVVTDRDKNKSAEVIRAFLGDPLDRKNFDKFFRLCYSETIPCLRRLRAAGWRLPEDQVQQERGLPDIAYDVLGPFFASKGNRPYFVIFDYFERHQLTDYEKTDPDMLLRHFRTLLRGFARKELTLVRGLINPQISNLKRRLRNIFAGDEYLSRVWPGETYESLYAARNERNLRDSLPPIDWDTMDDLVKEAFTGSRTRPEWCAGVFKLLDEKTESRNALPMHDLISMMVAVNAEYANASSLGTGNIPTPTEQYVNKRVSAALDEAVKLVQSGVLPRFVENGQLSADDAPRLLEACRTYLVDLSSHGSTGKLPGYFMDQKPDLSQSDYLSQYKYILNKAVSRGLEELRQRLRQDMTIWPFGSYIPDEE
ncbi:MAG: hypothetical protein JSU65_01610 [Candidatus Zixiibacteriota bacterium]|nr:MAG: hypothetical protein JSU65_01610 [candidate division Zixibacteria bacterium]